MPLNLLETFVAVAETGSFSTAAAMLATPQSAVSRRVLELEQRVGARLLYRGGHGVTLTPAGVQLLRGCGPLLSHLADVIALAAEAESVPAGDVSLALTPTLASVLAVELMDHVRMTWPRVRLRLLTGYSKQLQEWLHQGRVDLAVLGDFSCAGGLDGEALVDLPVIVAMNRTLAGAHWAGGLVDAAALSRLPLALLSRDQGLRRSLDAQVLASGKTLEPAYEVDDIGVLRQLAVAGKAAIVVPELAVRTELWTGQLIAASLDLPQSLQVRTVIATAKRRPVTPAAKGLAHVLQDLVPRCCRPLSG
jgi:LysR family transcriptional regulator, nitrogen assimilation regulatory protein